MGYTAWDDVPQIYQGDTQYCTINNTPIIKEFLLKVLIKYKKFIDAIHLIRAEGCNFD